VSRAEDGAVRKSADVAAAYDPGANRWRPLSPPAASSGSTHGVYSAVWTGKEMVVWGSADEAFDPATNHWRRLPRAPNGGRRLVVWTGHEMIGWGGGCCGDALATGVAYDPARNRWRTLPRSPLAGSQEPLGTWTGRELVIFVGNFDPNGKPWPARLARAAAYDPATNRWRRLASLPAPRAGANAVWDGHEVLVVGGRERGPSTAAVGFAFDPGTNRWRRLPRMETGRVGAAAVWTGKRLLVWGGETQSPGAAAPNVPAHGLAFDPTASRWSALPPAPVLGRAGPFAVWTGRSLILWGGGDTYPRFADGALFTP
jgi:hypothetical protein